MSAETPEIKTTEDLAKITQGQYELKWRGQFAAKARVMAKRVEAGVEKDIALAMLSDLSDIVANAHSRQEAQP